MAVATGGILKTFDLFEVGYLLIPQINKDEVQEEVDTYIKRAEKDFMRPFLGTTLYDEVVVELAKTTPGAKYTALQGYLNEIISCMAYYYYRKERATVSTSVGEQSTPNAPMRDEKARYACNTANHLQEVLMDEDEQEGKAVKALFPTEFDEFEQTLFFIPVYQF